MGPKIESLRAQIETEVNRIFQINQQKDSINLELDAMLSELEAMCFRRRDAMLLNEIVEVMEPIARIKTEAADTMRDVTNAWERANFAEETAPNEQAAALLDVLVVMQRIPSALEALDESLARQTDAA